MGRDSSLPAQAAAQPFTLDVAPLLGGAAAAGLLGRGAAAENAMATKEEAAVAAAAAQRELQRRVAALQAGGARACRGAGRACARPHARWGQPACLDAPAPHRSTRHAHPRPPAARPAQRALESTAAEDSALLQALKDATSPLVNELLTPAARAAERAWQLSRIAADTIAESCGEWVWLPGGERVRPRWVGPTFRLSAATGSCALLPFGVEGQGAPAWTQVQLLNVACQGPSLQYGLVREERLGCARLLSCTARRAWHRVRLCLCPGPARAAAGVVLTAHPHTTRARARARQTPLTYLGPSREPERLVGPECRIERRYGAEVRLRPRCACRLPELRRPRAARAPATLGAFRGQAAYQLRAHSGPTRACCSPWQ